MIDRSPVEAVFAAAETDDAAVLERLLAAEPALARARNADGLTPVMVARYRFALRALDLLVAAAHDELDVFEAAAVGRADLVRAALAVDPAAATAFGPDGFTALQLACFFGSEEAAAALLERGAEIEAVARNPMAIRPLHAAAAGRHLAISRRLVDAGADVNAVQRDSYTPLQEAAQNGDEPLVELLLAAGADLSARTADGRSAADLATAAGHDALAERLRTGGG